MTLSDPDHISLLDLQAACDDFGMPLAQALSEKADELRLRLFLKCIPNERLKPNEIEQFLIVVLKKNPSPELLAAVSNTTRGPRLSEDELIKLEEQQNGRCALCGCFLLPAVGPQVDHVIPVALRGKSEFSNYQLLCQNCNQGKKSMMGWLMGAPFLYDANRLSLRMRYCALARSRGTCGLACGNSSRNSEMEVATIIPVARGGRWIFDNVMTVCRPHARERERHQYEEAKIKLTQARYGRRLFGDAFTSPHGR